MRISFVIDSFNGGGKERRCLQVIQGLNKRGFNDIQLIIVNHGIAYPEIHETSAKIVIINRKNRHISDLQAIKEIKQHLIDFNPSIVQAWSRMSAIFVDIIRIRFRHKYKYIVSYVADCNTPSFGKKGYFINKLSLLLANKIVGNSQAGLKAYSVPKKKKVCIYNGFNPERYAKVNQLDLTEKKRELGIHTPYIISMVARIGRDKDYQAYINCANRILESRQDITFLAVGKGEYHHFYQTVIPSKNKDKIVFLGFRNDVEEIIKISNLTILFTNYRVHQEGISNSILESMALGIPVIATNDGGTPEIIRDGYNGFLVEQNNVEKSVGIVNNILSDKNTLLSLSQNCISTINEKFDLDKTTTQYINLYNSLIESV